VHERLDDEMRVYTEALCSLLYPHLLHPVPALTMIELRPKRGLVQGTVVMEAGTEVRSGPVGPERAVCRFRTTQPVRLQPVQLSDVELSWAGDGTSSVALRFAIDRGNDASELRLSPLRLHLLADPATASTMHLFFTRHVSRLKLTGESGDGAMTLQGGQWIVPGGLGEDEGLLPYASNVPMGLRLIQEYLCYRRKFWCVDILGLDRLRLDPNASSFSVEVFFDEAYPEAARFSREHIRMHCTPAVNLFSTDAEPIRVEHYEADYRVLPSPRFRKSMVVYDIEEVVGLEDGTAKRHTYTPYFAFRHGKTSGDDRLFVTRYRTAPGGLSQVLLSLAGSAETDPEHVLGETLSLRVRCTNGDLPRGNLQEGMIDKLEPSLPQIVETTNLTQPTRVLNPPVERHQDFFWQLVSHWSFNHLSLASREALVGLLSLYDWADSEANRRHLAGIRDVRWTAREMPYRGAVMRGAEMTVIMQDGHADDGELNLFGIVLARFLSLYATINSFVHLTIELTPSGKTFEWHPSQGSIPTL
jgi:type VI secretion system protein ImpG